MCLTGAGPDKTPSWRCMGDFSVAAATLTAPMHLASRRFARSVRVNMGQAGHVRPVMARPIWDTPSTRSKTASTAALLVASQDRQDCSVTLALAESTR
jgi:hypothetical protein